jgi:hypothetical protein
VRASSEFYSLESPRQSREAQADIMTRKQQAQATVNEPTELDHAAHYCQRLGAISGPSKMVNDATKTPADKNHRHRHRPKPTADHLTGCFVILLLTLCELLIITRQTTASGVFEFELVDLVRLDQSVKHEKHQEKNTVNPTILLHVCLKEAFTSQLDGLCAYGNVTLIVDQQQQQQHNRSSPLNERRSNGTLASVLLASGGGNQGAGGGEHEEHADGDLDADKQRGGSQMTNIVRLPFTFRWTVSLSGNLPPVPNLFRVVFR